MRRVPDGRHAWRALLLVGALVGAADMPRSRAVAGGGVGGGTIHWIHATTTTVARAHAALDGTGGLTGEPETTVLPSAPADIAVSENGDVVVSLPLDRQVLVQRPGAPEPVFVEIPQAQPHGIAIDGRTQRAFVVAREDSGKGATVYAIALRRSHLSARRVARWRKVENPVGLEIHGRRLYVACSGANGNPCDSDAVVARCNLGSPGQVRALVTGARQGYGVAVDPDRGLLHFTVSGEASLYSLELSRAAVPVPDPSATLPELAAGLSFDAVHGRVLVAVGLDAISPDTGVHAVTVSQAGAADPAVRIFQGAPVRAAYVVR